MINNLDNSQKYRAQAKPISSETWIDVTSSTETPASSYGLQHWVDANGNSYGQINLNSAFVEIRSIEVIE